MSASTPTDPAALSATQTLTAYRNRTLTPVDVLDAVEARLDRFEPDLNAFVLIDRAGARSQAEASAARWQRGAPIGLVDGVVTTIKDNINAKGFPARRGSAVTDTAPMTEDAPAVARLLEHGAVVLGRTTLPEFGWKGLSDSPVSGFTRNPWDRRMSVGGSSSGAVAACAMGIGALHIGTDGAGSIRIPASFTGVYGIKPSFGLVPAAPSSAFTVLSHVGPLTRTVSDAALMMSVIALPDSRDIFAWNTQPPDFRIGLDDGIRALRIAWSPTLGFVDNLDPEVAALCERAALRFERLGATVERVDHVMDDPWALIEGLWYAGSALVGSAFSAAQRARMDPGFVRVIEAAERMTVADFLKSFTGRAALAHAMAQFHQRYDLLLTPTMPIAAFKLGRDVPDGLDCGEGPLAWARWSPFTWPFNLTQQPAASVPCGFTKAGLPVGLQIVGAMRRDDLVLRASRAFEALAPFEMPSAVR